MIRRLAVGGMGEIFLARQSGVAGFDRLAILKTLLPDLADDPSHVEQFLDEARVAATLNHPNIVSIYEVGKWSDMYIIAMEYIRGENLARLMHALERLEEKMPRLFAARIVQAAALALDHAHHACDTEGRPLGIVHRDIGLQNIMVRDDGVTKVVDFGIAQAANRSTRTRTGLIKGKLHYMSPEQVLGKALDGRSDQFSLGIVLWEMVTGKRLLKIDDDMEVIRRLTQEALPSPTSIDPSIPAELDAIIMRMLAREREDRFSRASEVAAALEHYVECSGESVTDTQVAEFVAHHFGKELAERTRDLTPSQESFASSLSSQRFNSAPDHATAAIRPSKKHSRRWLAVVIPLVFVLAGVGTWWVTSTPPTPRPVVAVAAPKPKEPPPPLPKPAAPMLQITTMPPGATIRLGTEALGVTPATITTLEAEVTHGLELTKIGFQPATMTIRLSPGETRSMTVPLTALPRTKSQTPRPPANNNQSSDETAKGNGYVTLDTKPWAKVAIDGKPYGSTPLYKVELAPGPHVLHLENEGASLDVERKIIVRPGKTQKLNLDLRR